MKKGFVTIELDGNSFQLKEEQDFSWLSSFGKVFRVFDQNDSGNVSFGVERNGKRFFLKYAGASPINYDGTAQDAIDRLKQAMPLYQQLRHPNLVKLEQHHMVGQGYLAVFDWFEGECLHPYWSFPPPAKYVDPKSPFYQYRMLPITGRLASLEQIFSFHIHVESQGFVAIDFYDGSILYDFSTNTLMICDIDFYQSRPYLNTIGKLWGSSRFMSPEEFQLGASIDQRTNVFNMGATAFVLIGGGLDRSFAKWEAGRNLYEVACRAVNKDRQQRFTSVNEFALEWRKARIRDGKDN